LVFQNVSDPSVGPSSKEQIVGHLANRWVRALIIWSHASQARSAYAA
jgi:hypothetical protein